MKYVVWVSTGYFFLGVYKLFVGHLLYHKRTKILAYLALVNVIISLALNYFLIQKFGAIGAAYTTFITMLLFMFLACIISNKISPLPWLYF